MVLGNVGKDYFKKLCIRTFDQNFCLGCLNAFKDFFSKCDHIRRKLQIWLHLLNKSLMENFIFCAVDTELISQLITVAVIISVN